MGNTMRTGTVLLMLLALATPAVAGNRSLNDLLNDVSPNASAESTSRSTWQKRSSRSASRPVKLKVVPYRGS